MSEEIVRPKGEIVGKLSPATLGVPQAALADETVNKVTMGQIIGRATQIKRAQKKDSITGAVEILYGLKGSFIAIPADTKKPETRSSVLYLPEGLAGDLIDRFKEADDDGEVISSDIAMEMFVIRAKNPAGYSWGARPLLDSQPEAEDPVAKLRASIAQKALSAPTAEPETLTIDTEPQKVAARE